MNVFNEEALRSIESIDTLAEEGSRGRYYPGLNANHREEFENVDDPIQPIPQSKTRTHMLSDRLWIDSGYKMSTMFC